MAKLGSKERPAVVHVEIIERAGEIMALCDKNKWQVIVGIEPDKPEDLSDLTPGIGRGLANMVLESCSYL